MKTPWNCEWYAVIEEFDLKAHAYRMKGLYPWWTNRQCRNLLYWQGRVRSRLRKKTYDFFKPGDVILEIPEACGINVFETMALVGVELKRNPDVVKKIMMIGRERGK